VAIVRLRSLGDCVLDYARARHSETRAPDLRVAVVVEDRFRAVFEDNPDVDDILRPSIAVLRRWRPDLCLNLHGGTRSAWMTRTVRRPNWRAGFGHFRHQWAYNLHIPRAQEILGVERTVHTAEHLASAMFWLGAPAVGDSARAAWWRATGRPRGYAVIHPWRRTGKDLARRWISGSGAAI
jgi:heptosyltransferase III